MCGGQRFAGLWIQRVQGAVMEKVYACRAAYGVFVYRVGDHYTISVFGDVNCWCDLPCHALVCEPVSILCV